jgi:hypothetical protein
MKLKINRSRNAWQEKWCRPRKWRDVIQAKRVRNNFRHRLLQVCEIVTHQGEKRPSCTHTRRQNPEVSTGATVPCHLITLTRPIGNRGLRLIATVRPFGTVAINLNPSILTSNNHGTAAHLSDHCSDATAAPCCASGSPWRWNPEKYYPHGFASRYVAVGCGWHYWIRCCKFVTAWICND